MNKASAQASIRPRAVLRSPRNMVSMRFATGPKRCGAHMGMGTRERQPGPLAWLHPPLLSPALSRVHNHRNIFAPLGGQSSDHTCPVGCRPVLTHLPLAFQARDLDRKPDDASQHALHEIRRGVGARPGYGAAVFVAFGQARDDIQQAVWIVEQCNWTSGMDRHVVPGWDHFAGLALGLVP